MNGEAQIKDLEQRVNALISTETDLFLVEVRIKPTNNIKVFIDGNQGVSIEKLVHYHRRLYKQLEEENIYPAGDFSLEVSSPGLEEPLKLYRQYLKNIGRFVEVTDNEEQKREGKLIRATEDGIVIEETTGKGKKMPARMNRSGGETVQHTISFSEIKTTRVQIKF